MKTIKYILLSAVLIGFTACNEPEDILNDYNIDTSTEVLPELTAGTADFSTYVSIGNSLTAGFTDSALFIASQENSFPNILSQKFALVGGGTFTQPLMNDNLGGIALGGTQLPGPSLGPRLVFGGAALGIIPITTLIGPAVSSTDLAVNNPTGPFNNMGIPGASSFHLIAPGYGNIANLSAGLANPYFIRMTGATPNATIMEMTMAQSPSFVSLWVGANDVLGYATGGAANGAPTPQPTFDFAMSQIMGALGGTQGIMANIPYITDLPYFTRVPYNPIPLDAGTAAQLNAGYATYNGGLQFALANNLIDAAEAAARTIVFQASATNTMVLIDEDLTDLTIYGIPSYRQSTSSDLFVLTLSPLIPQGYGTQIPLADNWVVTSTEKDEIITATDGYNATIQAAASAAGFAFVDANAIFQQMASGGYTDGDYTLTADLVFGGAVSLDGVHPTSRGYALVANEMMKAIDATYGSNFEASGNLVNIGNYPTNYSHTLQ